MRPPVLITFYMNKKLFIDTNAFVAVINNQDERHKQALAISRDVLPQWQKPYLTSDYILDETYTFLRMRVGHQVAVAFGEEVRSGKTDLEVVPVSPNILEAAWQLFKRYDDKRFSFTDCTSFVMMRERDIRSAFSFDEHFTQVGFEIIQPLNRK